MKITFVLEWENAILSELERTSELLTQIHLQSNTQKQAQFELLILHNSEQVSEEFISDFLRNVLNEKNLPEMEETRVLDVKDAHYFQLKNEGVRHAKGETVIILDSDIIPQAGWLEALLNAHQKYPEAIIAGATHIDYSDFIGKCFALAWFFPAPSDRSDMESANLIFSNNFICKKQLLIDNPYPKMAEGVTRGADTLLWKDLERKGVKLFICHQAKASHPAPNGWEHFFNRALAEGRDDYLRLFERDFQVGNPEFRFFKIYLLRSKNTIVRIWKNRAKVNLSLWQVPFATITMLTYYLFYLIGGIITKATPRYAKVSWQI